MDALEQNAMTRLRGARGSEEEDPLTLLRQKRIRMLEGMIGKKPEAVENYVLAA